MASTLKKMFIIGLALLKIIEYLLILIYNRNSFVLIINSL